MFDGVFQLLRAKEREIDARRDQVEALREFWLANADLEQLLMGRVPSELRDSMERGGMMQSDAMMGDRQARFGANHE